MPDLKSLNQYLHLFSRPKDMAEFEQIPGFISRLLETVESLVVVLDTEGRIREFNPACERLSGYTREEMIGKKYDLLIPAEELAEVKNKLELLMAGNFEQRLEYHWLSREGKKRLLLWSSSNVKNDEGQISCIICTGLDITDLREFENRRLVVLEILETLAGTGTQAAVLQQVLQTIKTYFDCDAVALRLRKGDDYPYTQAIGFSEEFLRQESTLCSFEGCTIKRDADGLAVLDCLCGRVIRGDYDYVLTAEGVLITGNINKFVAVATAGQEQSFTIRNYCGQSGYQSVALIPLRSNQETVGLLQLNAYEENHFSEVEIAFLTIVGQSIAAALVRFQAEQERRKAELILNTIVQKAQDGFLLSTLDGKAIIYNEAMRCITGYTCEDINQYNWFYLLFPDEEMRRLAVNKARQAVAGRLEYMETEITCKDGSEKRVVLSLTPLEIEGKTYVFSTMRLPSALGAVTPAVDLWSLTSPQD
jgi:PAS domain S-box-containing protein